MVVMVSNPDSADHQTTPTTPPSSSPTHETNLLTLLRNQLEYYFSKDNLATDKYLCKSPYVLSLYYYCCHYNSISNG